MEYETIYSRRVKRGQLAWDGNYLVRVLSVRKAGFPGCPAWRCQVERISNEPMTLQQAAAYEKLGTKKVF